MQKTPQSLGEEFSVLCAKWRLTEGTLLLLFPAPQTLFWVYIYGPKEITVNKMDTGKKQECLKSIKWKTILHFYMHNCDINWLAWAQCLIHLRWNYSLCKINGIQHIRLHEVVHFFKVTWLKSWNIKPQEVIYMARLASSTEIFVCKSNNFNLNFKLNNLFNKTFIISILRSFPFCKSVWK